MSIPLKLNQESTSFIVIQWIYFAVITLDILILVPFGLYYAKKIWIVRNVQFFNKRHPKLTISSIFILLPYIIIIRTIADLPRIIPSITMNVYIRLFCYNLVHVPFMAVFIRLWFLYYDYNQGLQLISKEFQTRVEGHDTSSHWAINPKYHFLSPNSNKPYYICIAWVIFVEIVILISEIWYLSAITSIFFYVILFIMGVSIAFKIRSCRDELFLRKEAQLLGYLGLFVSVFYILVWFLLDDELKVLGHCVLISIGVFFGEYIITKWILNQYLQRAQNSTKTLKRQDSVNSKTKVPLLEILRHQDGFDLFAIHCVKEFSIENLLFLFEGTKLKKQCYGMIISGDETKNDEETEKKIGIIIQFAEKTDGIVRQRSIIHGIDDFMYNFQYIYNRYLSDRSEYCVNVSYAIRKRMREQMDKMSNGTPNRKSVIDSMHVMMVASHSQSSLTKERRSRGISGAETPSRKLSDNLSLGFDTDGNVKQNIIECIELLNEAMNEIFQLLSTDSLMRFSQTDAYKQIFDVDQNK